MRLWPLAILGQLPRQQLLGQHRECCALRGRGWGRKHATVDYVFNHPYWWLCLYHEHVLHELERRGYKYDDRWRIWCYRGKTIGFDYSQFTWMMGIIPRGLSPHGIWSSPIYPEHNEIYLDDCLANLASKGVNIKKKDMTEISFRIKNKVMYADLRVCGNCAHGLSCPDNVVECCHPELEGESTFTASNMTCIKWTDRKDAQHGKTE